MLEFAREFLRFVRARKKLWLVPVLLLMAVLGMLLVATQGSVVAPFIYTLF